MKRIALLSLLFCLVSVPLAQAGPLPGAIFTTLYDGSSVNKNIYQKKTDVYLNGGPPINAPKYAASLPDGCYYFQVTEPSGKRLLSTDAVKCRVFCVKEGVIHEPQNDCLLLKCEPQSDPTAIAKYRGTLTESSCLHDTDIEDDFDHYGATIQLFPFDDTKNRGGVYKVWATPIGEYEGDTNTVDGGPKALGTHGFIHSWSKTDNFKVKQPGKPCPPPELSIYKFHDKDLDGEKDAGEEGVTGWKVVVTDPLQPPMPVDYFTPVTGDDAIIAEPPGVWTLVEDTPAGTLQTVARLDGVVKSEYPTADPEVQVDVAGNCDETHEVIYGNVGLGEITACKVFDRNGNGEVDDGEPGIPGWRMEVTGVDVRDVSYGPVTQATGADGCATFTDLLPGTYTVTELVPNTTVEWVSTGPASFEVTIESSLDGSVMIGTNETVTFTNYCEGTADFDTKGYWHNKNGLGELTQLDIINDVNDLEPYETASTYFDACSEPFDGSCQNGTTTPVPAVNGEWGEQIAGAGTWQAEISHFLVDPNAGGDPREQLAQQLLAFYFNVSRLGSCATIQKPDLTWVSASDLINEAIAAWGSTDAAWQTSLKNLLDALNNNDMVPYIPCEPCDVVYE
jgi:hypothetical protein